MLVQRRRINTLLHQSEFL